MCILPMFLQILRLTQLVFFNKLEKGKSWKRFTMSHQESQYFANGPRLTWFCFCMTHYVDQNLPRPIIFLNLWFRLFLFISQSMFCMFFSSLLISKAVFTWPTELDSFQNQQLCRVFSVWGFRWHILSILFYTTESWNYLLNLNQVQPF